MGHSTITGPIPADKWDVIKAQVIAKQLALNGWSTLQEFDHHVAWVEKYITDSPGYHGPVVMVLWPGSPDLVSVITLDKVTGWEMTDLIPFKGD